MIIIKAEYFLQYLKIKSKPDITPRYYEENPDDPVVLVINEFDCNYSWLTLPHDLFIEALYIYIN